MLVLWQVHHEVHRYIEKHQRATEGIIPIQKVMDRNGFQIRINYNRQRVVIWLSKASKRQAMQFERQMQALVVCKVSGAVMDPDTAQWLRGLSDDLYQRIADKGLVSPREPQKRGISWSDAALRFNKEFSGKHTTALQHAQCQRDFSEFLRLQGRPDAMLNEITRGDAKAFEGYLFKRRTPCLAKATVRKKLSRVKQVFRWGLLNKYLAENPLDEVRTASVANKETYLEIPSSTIHGILSKIECSDTRMVLALCRFGGFRYNETAVNTWEECVDLEEGTLTIKSNKTPAIRTSPLFADLRPYLEAVPEADRHGSLQKRWPAHQSSREAIKTLIREAGYEPWPKVLHNLRKNRATELLANFPPQSVASWLGHEVKVLLDYYAIIKSEDFTSARDFCV